MSDQCGSLKGKRFTLGKDYYTQWDFRVWFWGVEVQHGGYGRAVPLWWPWAIIPFVVKRSQGKAPLEIPPPNLHSP